MSISLLFAAHLVLQDPAPLAQVEALEKCVVASGDGTGCGVSAAALQSFTSCVARATIDVPSFEEVLGYHQNWSRCEAKVGCLDVWTLPDADPLERRRCRASHLAILKTLATRWHPVAEARAAPAERALLSRIMKLPEIVDQNPGADVPDHDPVDAQVIAWTVVAQMLGSVTFVGKGLPEPPTLP